MIRKNSYILVLVIKPICPILDFAKTHFRTFDTSSFPENCLISFSEMEKVFFVYGEIKIFPM